jgi:hypothetical protein
MDVMNPIRPSAPDTANATQSRDDWVREVFAVAEALRQRGRHRRLRDVTIVLPIDYAAVEGIELACRVLIEGDVSPAARELDEFFDRLVEDPLAADRFLDSVRSVARRVGEANQRL